MNVTKIVFDEGLLLLLFRSRGHLLRLWSQQLILRDVAYYVAGASLIRVLLLLLLRGVLRLSELLGSVHRLLLLILHLRLHRRLLVLLWILSLELLVWSYELLVLALHHHRAIGIDHLTIGIHHKGLLVLHSRLHHHATCVRSRVVNCL